MTNYQRVTKCIAYTSFRSYYRNWITQNKQKDQKIIKVFPTNSKFKVVDNGFISEGDVMLALPQSTV